MFPETHTQVSACLHGNGLVISVTGGGKRQQHSGAASGNLSTSCALWPSTVCSSFSFFASSSPAVVVVLPPHSSCYTHTPSMTKRAVQSLCGLLSLCIDNVGPATWCRDSLWSSGLHAYIYYYWYLLLNWLLSRDFKQYFSCSASTVNIILLTIYMNNQYIDAKNVLWSTFRRLLSMLPRPLRGAHLGQKPLQTNDRRETTVPPPVPPSHHPLTLRQQQHRGGHICWIKVPNRWNLVFARIKSDLLLLSLWFLLWWTF